MKIPKQKARIEIDILKSPPHRIDIQMHSLSRNLIYSYAIFDEVYFKISHLPVQKLHLYLKLFVESKESQHFRAF